MATLSHETNTRKDGTTSTTWRILWVAPDGSRKTLRLGKVPKRVAQEYKVRVETIVAALRGGWAVDADTAGWIGSRPDDVHERLVAVGLAEPRVKDREPSAMTLEQLCQAFKDRAHVKPASVAAYGQTIDSLTRYMGATRPIASIGVEDADAWRQWIATDKEGNSRRKKKRTTDDNRLSVATQAKRTHHARQIFNKAVEWGWLPKNPLAKLKAGSQSNAARNFYVDIATTEALIDAAPGIEWRTLIGLTRLAGLRCPSEVGLLRWQDVDFAHGRLTVRSPKTEHHGAEHAIRFVPISPRLRTLLADAFDAAADGETLVVPMASSKAKNLRKALTTIIERAGRKPWPRRFQNLRASIECDWVQEYPAHVVAKWLGHSVKIQAEHYLQVRDAHFKAVIEGNSPGTESGTVGARKEASVVDGCSASGFDFHGKSDISRVVNTYTVDRAGIEPATHGFSVRCSTN